MSQTTDHSVSIVHVPTEDLTGHFSNTSHMRVRLCQTAE